MAVTIRVESSAGTSDATRLGAKAAFRAGDKVIIERGEVTFTAQKQADGCIFTTVSGNWKRTRDPDDPDLSKFEEFVLQELGGLG